MVGMIQATETVQSIMGIGQTLVGRLLRYDALEMKFREYKLRRDTECPVCGDHPTIHELIDYHQFCGVPQGQMEDAKPIEGDIDPTEVKQKIDNQSLHIGPP